MIKVARFLEVGVVLDYGSFQGFRGAFDPAEIMWDIDPRPIVERARSIETGTDDRPCRPDNGHAIGSVDGVEVAFWGHHVYRMFGIRTRLFAR